ncbi:MAG: nuclear transport factor 2 family protein [Thermomicrobia bacterium]|nr:nuclear transport factor 2 family protein [Thermomicrobia bacterium]
MRLRNGLLCALMLAMIMAVTPAAAADDPATVLQRFNDARNSGDIAGAVALLTDDVRFVEGPCTADNPCIGVAATREPLEAGAVVHVRVTVVGTPVVTGTTVRFRAEVRFDNVPAGVERIIENTTVEVRDGKIASYFAILDLSDAQTAKLIAAQPLPQRPPSAPRTGGGGEASFIHRLGDG